MNRIKGNNSMYKAFFKRFFDIAFAVFAILALGLPMLIIAIVVRIDSKGPALFKQKRVGKDKRCFTILKFRTMITDTPNDTPTDKLKEPEKWITRSGRLLRMTSLDELPQLFNILVGHMSLIGPRPALPNQLDLIGERDKNGANGIRPGLTGWAQVNGRDRLDNTAKATFDGEYVKKMSVGFDLKCLFLTVGTVLRFGDVLEGEGGN